MITRGRASSRSGATRASQGFYHKSAYPSGGGRARVAGCEAPANLTNDGVHSNRGDAENRLKSISNGAAFTYNARGWQSVQFERVDRLFGGSLGAISGSVWNGGGTRRSRRRWKVHFAPPHVCYKITTCSTFTPKRASGCCAIISQTRQRVAAAGSFCRGVFDLRPAAQKPCRGYHWLGLRNGLGLESA